MSERSESLLAAVRLTLEAATPEGAIAELAGALPGGPPVRDGAGIVAAALAREKEGTTWLGHGLALPHARTDAVEALVAAVGRSPEGIPWGPEGERAHLVVFAGVPKTQVRGYLEFIRQLSLAMRDDAWPQSLLAAPDEATFRAAWRRAMHS